MAEKGNGESIRPSLSPHFAAHARRDSYISKKNEGKKYGESGSHQSCTYWRCPPHLWDFVSFKFAPCEFQSYQF